ncbi:hypothetical protein CC86DRAFT_397618 [Ophiobolus disseminans]|uniref:Uncharacterized protein n=1 Tax=Ophiobolus disseminans TaxID=1469910 RepID=A0A6A6ZJ75_9PLEO|nr:hypothetical protein CC86DRAFT_397618 [Ophiobolus disseminans]
MADPVTYSFYGTTVPVLRSCCKSAISILTTAQKELSDAEPGKFPDEKELLDAHFGTMFAFRQQPIMLAKFPLVALQHHSLSSAPAPSLDPSSFDSLASVVDFFQKMDAVLAGVDEAKFNDAAEKGVDVPFQQAGKTLHMSGMADFYHGFVVPNAYFHLNAMYMLLRSKGFALGKGVYVGSWMSETQMKDWAPLRG